MKSTRIQEDDNVYSFNMHFRNVTSPLETAFLSEVNYVFIDKRCVLQQ